MHVQPEDSNNADIQVQTITIGGYPDSKLEVIHYSNAASDYIPVQPDDVSDQSLDTWSVIWYIASFGGLILFFLIVSCSEWCCRRNARRNCQRTTTSQNPTQVVLDTPPPSYDQFAPPAYEDLWVGSSRGSRGEKSEYDIYVVPVHALGTIMEEARREEAPPSYQSASAGFVQPNDIPTVHSSNSPSVT